MAEPANDQPQESVPGPVRIPSEMFEHLKAMNPRIAQEQEAITHAAAQQKVHKDQADYHMRQAAMWEERRAESADRLRSLQEEIAQAQQQPETMAEPGSAATGSA